MKLRTREIGDVAILDLEGKVDGADLEVLVPALRTLVESGHRKVLLNLEAVRWMNSTGLGILIAGYSDMLRSGGVLKLMKVPPRIASLLSVSQLGTVFESFDEDDQALRSFV